MYYEVHYLGKIHHVLTDLAADKNWDEDSIWNHLQGTVPYGFNPNNLYAVKSFDNMYLVKANYNAKVNGGYTLFNVKANNIPEALQATRQRLAESIANYGTFTGDFEIQGEYLADGNLDIYDAPFYGNVQ